MYGLRVTGRHVTGPGTHWLVIPIILFCMGATPSLAVEEPMETRREYKIKASFLYNFLFYVTWPDPEPGNTGGPDHSKFVIGVIGEDPFGDFFKIAEKKSIYNKRIVIRRFDDNAQPSLLAQCHILFISTSLEPVVGRILDSIKDFPVLTVSETEEFGEKGGMINFVTAENSVAFDINKRAADKVGIILSSKLLRIASSIVETKHGR